MALTTTFDTITSPATGSELDVNFGQVGAQGTIRCTASGTNAITLTPVTGQSAVSAYGTGYPIKFGFVAASTTTAAVTLKMAALAFLPLYVPSGAQAGSGDLLSGFYYEIVYTTSSAYNSGNGAFVVTSNLPATGSTPIELGSTRHLTMFNNSGTPNTQISIAAAKAVLVTSSGLPLLVSAPSVTINLATTGANGMDTGARPTSDWVYCYLISNGAATAGLASAVSPTTGGPTLPSGYIYTTYVGAMYCDGSQNLLRSRQIDAQAQFTVVASTNTAIVPTIANGVAGTYSDTAPVLAAVTVVGNAGWVPLTASAIVVNAYGAWKGNAPTSVIVAPNTGWGGANNGVAGSAGQVWPIFVAVVSYPSIQATIQLEAATIAWASGGTGGVISAMGWTDGWVR